MLFLHIVFLYTCFCVSSVHGISQERILEWVDISFFRGCSQPRDWTLGSCCISCIAGDFFTAESPGKPCLCAQISLLYKGISHIGLGLTLITSLQLNQLQRPYFQIISYSQDLGVKFQYSSLEVTQFIRAIPIAFTGFLKKSLVLPKIKN